MEHLPVPMSAYGPLIPLSLRVHALSHTGRCDEALTAADAYIRLATVAGDERTVSFLIQGKMYANLMLGRHTEALAIGADLLRRHQATGYALGEAKTLADLAELCVLDGRYVEGMRHLARSALLLDAVPRRDDRYRSAVASLAEAANAAELYETAAAAYERLFGTASHPKPAGPADTFQLSYAITLLYWGYRLDHIGRYGEAAGRLRHAATLSRRWTEVFVLSGPPSAALNTKAMLAAALAKLGDHDEARRLAEEIVVPLRSTEHYWAARLAHLALGICLRATGDHTAARREFVAAEQLCAYTSRPDERLIIRYEMALLAVDRHGPEATRDLFDGIADQVHHLWGLRLQRLAMLRQARQREELETARARAESALLVDPLTGLGNRRRFDQLMADAELLQPTTLLVIDVDKFKLVNDHYSHSAGDEVLRGIGAILRAHCRAAADIPVRFAGDEFTVFLHTDLDGGREVAERIRAAVAGWDFSHVTPGMTISISTGVAALLPGMTGEDLFHAADARLYEAKRRGRNQVA
jgi:diguanylate cyclase